MATPRGQLNWTGPIAKGSNDKSGSLGGFSHNLEIEQLLREAFEVTLNLARLFFIFEVFSKKARKHAFGKQA